MSGVSGVVMNSSAVQEALSTIRDCAFIMLENASYVQRELPNVEMTDLLRSQTAEVCDAMVGTKHDIISELFEIDELLKSDAELAVISSRFNRSIRWLWEDLSKLDQLVMALRADSQKNKNHIGASILVEESAANILNVFNRAKAAVDAVVSESNDKRNA
jgi:flagellar biosynthesis/type III secretory pathway chaperone